jgi:hypothetical protein
MKKIGALLCIMGVVSCVGAGATDSDVAIGFSIAAWASGLLLFIWHRWKE